MKTIYDIFKELDIAYNLYDHPPFYTCDESEKWYDQNIDEKSGESKNIFLRNKEGNNHFLVVIESKKRLDLKILATRLGEKKLSVASEERLKKYLNLTPGAVSIFALIHENAKDIEVIFDDDLLKHKKLHYHPPARNDQTIILSADDVKKFIEWVGNPIKFMTL